MVGFSTGVSLGGVGGGRESVEERVDTELVPEEF